MNKQLKEQIENARITLREKTIEIMVTDEGITIPMSEYLLFNSWKRKNIE